MIEIVAFIVSAYAVVLSLSSAIGASFRLKRFFKYRKLRKFWKYKDGETVIIVCSEGDDPENRQWPEEREFIYLLKYGDVDAFFELAVTLIRIYPNIDLKFLSSGEAMSSKLDFTENMIFIGGPDYNLMTKRILEMGATRFTYRSPYFGDKSLDAPNEITIYDKFNDKEYYDSNKEIDYGYIERIISPNDQKKSILIFGGCHTIGVTAGIRMFSLLGDGRARINPTVKKNAKLFCKKKLHKTLPCILFRAQKVGASILSPSLKQSDVLGTKSTDITTG